MTDADTPAAADEPLGQRLLTAAFSHPVADLRLVETHVSWVILTGPWAYKVKKPVQLDFLDYSTMQQRQQLCDRELRINRLWAAEIYCDVVPIFERAGRLRVAQAGEPPQGDEQLVDHAVQMRQFPQSALLAEQLKAEVITPDMMERLADDLALLHERVEPADESPSRLADCATAAALENFVSMLGALGEDDTDRARVAALQDWTQRESRALAPLMHQRHRERRVRYCHGDLHLENLLYLDGRFIPFDGIEFNDTLRQIDVLSEVAFLVMELGEHDHRSHAHALVNRYLEATQDYGGIALLPFYLVYRAMVRAKVDLIRQVQSVPGSRPQAGTAELSEVGRRYVAYAERNIQPRVKQLWITSGVSGSGKSVAARAVVQKRGFLRIRSDVVRKLLAGHDPFANERTKDPAGGRAAANLVPSAAQRASDTPPAQLERLYSAEMTQRTYQRLWDQAQQILSAGFSVIVDATFLKREHRALFSGLADRSGAAFGIVCCEAPLPELERRILARHGDPSDASLAVLHAQIASAQPLSGDELSWVVSPGAIGL